ncbi:tyrosine recombinase XerC [Nostoc sp. PCC 7107]|uniref:site-specific integrase n=1 Tax=Nostoc sp. PCC 7107 TaxID=317936 RepID=UPI00029ECE0F|nr:tyrosine-type recombinase/integrase [Nostoc sp. PCC 7107]AFY45458.1 integrase family protein [Nostoc sp. PCC 7107]
MLLRAKKGSVTINAKSGKLRIVLPRNIGDGKQHYIYTGFDDTVKNRKKVQMVALQIETDIEDNCLDCTLDKYRTMLGVFRGQQRLQIIPKAPNLKQLWAKYCEFKQPQVSASTFNQDFLGSYAKAINNLPTNEIKDAIAIRDHLIQTYPPYTAKRYLTQFNACCKWAVKSKLTASNPFDGLTVDIKVKRWDTSKIDPFTLAERDAIIQAFEQHPLYIGYTNFVRFLFFTGCRIGEAIALQWKHINIDCTEIYFCESYSFHGRKETKTGVNRKFPCNEQLRAFLLSAREHSPTPEKLVFPALGGGEIKANSFTGVVWRGGVSHGVKTPGIVTQLVTEGKVSRYRPVYNTRHTFISLCLERGVSVQRIARWVGNSPEVIYKHYAGVLGDATVPEL